jgi:MFS family permease
VSDSAVLPPRFDPARRRRVTFALALVTALASFESTVVSTAMPTIIGDLGGLAVYSWVFAAYLLASTLTMPVYGRLADLYGRRRMLLVAGGFFLAGAACCAFSRSMPALIAARSLQGLGAGGLVPLSLTVAGDLFSIQDRARVQGLFSGIWGLASLTGPLIGAGMTVAFGWRSIFAINIPLGLVALALVATQLVETRAHRSDPLDVAGALTLAASVTALLAAVTRRADAEGLPLALRGALFAAGLLLAVAFVRLERRRAHPLIPTVLFSSASRAAPYVGGLVLGTTIYGVDTFVPLFVQGARGGTAGAAGAVVTPLVLGWSVSATLAARAIVRWGFRRTARTGALLVLAGLAGLVAASLLDAPVWAISVVCGVIGSGLGPSSLSHLLTVQHASEEEVRGSATALVPFSRTIGGSLGVAALGGIFSAGLAARLGPAAADAGRLLAHGAGEAGASAVSAASATAAQAAALRLAIEHSLLPVFAVLLLLAFLNLGVAGRLPRSVEERPERGAEAR